MKFKFWAKTLILYGLLCAMTISCNHKTDNSNEKVNEISNIKAMNKSYNPVVYFEIPVTNLDRATKFYRSVFSFKFEKETIDKNEMVLFLFTGDNPGISGALAKGEIYKPTKKV